MQDTGIWTPPTGTLGRILSETAGRIEDLVRHTSELRGRAEAAPVLPPARSLARALAQREDVAIVAEIKRRSPSKGTINDGISAGAQAAAYAAGGAAAISVLTEPLHFGGSVEDLAIVSQAVWVPVLRKDFCVHEVQLLEARAHGASVVLLIARAIPPDHLSELAASAYHLGLEVLLEVRNERELQTALAVKSAVIGVNNRNLESLELDAGTSQRLIPLVPPDRLVVYESGIVSRSDVERAAAMGADAVLAGSALSAAPDPQSAVRLLSGVARKKRVAAG